MPKIFDCFTYFNEVDVLKMRLEELAPVVDTFFLVEGNLTFRGNEKPLFDWTQDWLNPYRHQMQHVVADLEPVTDNPWVREVYQRNLATSWLEKYVGYDPLTTVIISDVDEIPRRSAVRHVNEATRLRLKKFSYGLNMLTDEGNTAAFMAPLRTILEATPEHLRRDPNVSAIIEDAGWEFSSLGTPEEVLVKLKSFSHSEFDTPDLTVELLKSRMENRQDIVGRDMWHTVVPIDDTWPEAVKRDREYWSKYEW